MRADLAIKKGRLLLLFSKQKREIQIFSNFSTNYIIIWCDWLKSHRNSELKSFFIKTWGEWLTWYIHFTTKVKGKKKYDNNLDKISWSIAKYPVFPLYFAWCCHWWWQMKEQQKQISWLNCNSLFPEWQNDPMSHCKLILVSLSY